jgi:acyl-CoA thioester hydrolase
VTTIRVRFHELDPYGHLNHGVYLNYFEQARVELLDRIGFGLPRLAELGFHIVVVEVQVRFVAPAYSGDEVTITSRIRDLRRVSSTWHQEMVRGDEVIATNDVRAAITDLDGRPTSAPTGLREALIALAAGDDGARDLAG